MPAAYDEALRRVLLDLPPDLVTATIAVELDRSGAGYRFQPPDGESRHLPLEMTEDVEMATQVLADLIQEDVLKSLWSASWPQCPWHEHPPLARLIDGEAVWLCARSGYRVARIGEMNQRRRRPPGR
jgi:hypothetical protein